MRMPFTAVCQTTLSPGPHWSPCRLSVNWSLSSAPPHSCWDDSLFFFVCFTFWFIFVFYIFKCLTYYHCSHTHFFLYLLIFTSIFSTLEMLWHLWLDCFTLTHFLCPCVMTSCFSSPILFPFDRFPELLEMSSGKPKPVGTLGTH